MSITLDGSNLTTVGVINSATAQNSTSGTSIDFTGIPSGVKRVTVMFSGVSTNGTSNIQVQLGAGSVTTTGYVSTCAYFGGTGSTSTGNASTAGFLVVMANAATNSNGGIIIITTLGGNIWTYMSNITYGGGSLYLMCGAGNISLGGTLDRVRITTANGTDTFDAGSINILYE